MTQKELKKRVWGKASKVHGKDPSRNRRDAKGNEIYFHSYGKNTVMGWEIDHKKPRAKGGSDSIRNLHPLQTAANRKKSDKY